MFEIEIPDSKAPKKEFDKLHDTHLGFAEVMLKETIPEKLDQYRERLKKAVNRKHFIESVPNQARWFIKFQKGVSDILKAKCLPMNKATCDEIARCYKGIVVRQGEIQKKVIVAAHNYPRDADDSPIVTFTFKVFAKAYNELVAGFNDLQMDLENDYKSAVRKEKDAIDLLKKYLAKKDNFKEALDKKEVTASEYEAFKKKYENLAKSL